MLLVVLVVGVALWWTEPRPEAPDVAEAREGIEALRADLERETAARQAAEESLRRAEQELEIQRAEVRAFADDIDRQESELLVLRDELAFYQRLAEGGGGDVLGVRALRLQRTGQAGVFDVAFQFYRPGLNRSLDLDWSLEVEGRSADGEDRVTLDAEDLGLDADRSMEGLRLLRSQRVRIRLPEDFEPQRLTLRAVARDEEDIDPVTEQAEWDRLLEEEP
ncbi:DUF6776 family protein [Thioalkalivibrio sp. ALJ16]|uniref:DUF6776 family protein n=1 Tax=Thioalkalivibrio sp. ALJ16 TaxID=1158762 RepID=UPI000477A9CC|nr:DUF6776 family protein [Thioalkalivibrio sp. ALJ16]